MMDVERGRRVDSIDGPHLAKIKESLDSLHYVLEEQNQFGIYQIGDDALSGLEQHVHFIDIPTLKDRAKFRLNQAFTGNRKMATDLNGKINIIYSELMRKFDVLSEHIKRLYSQVAENTTAIKKETGRLPGRTDANPKSQVNVVLLRSKKCLTPSAIEINYAEIPAEVEKTGESRSQPIILDNPNTKSEISRQKGQFNTEEADKATINLDEEEEELEGDMEIN
ncbi:hypothetical protein F2Q70_00035706 [Brassica cretica]|nr:hypothetical protein F2Q70_00035706 [Brassica cretica]